MKITFEDKSYIDCYKSNEPGKIVLVISAKDSSDPLKKITNACEISVDDFKKMVEEALK